MSVTYTIPVQRVTTSVGSDIFTDIEQTTISFTFDASVTTVSYVDLGTDPENFFPFVLVQPEEDGLTIDGRTLDEIFAEGLDIFTYFGQLQWSAGTTYILALEEFPFSEAAGEPRFETYAVIAGAPLPTFTSAEDANLFLFENQDGLGAVPNGTPFSAGSPIPLADIPGVQISGDTGPAGPTPGPDSLTGGDEPDDIDALAGDDTIDGGAGDDTLNGNDGNDSILGGAGDDSILDGSGFDTVRGGAGDDTIDNQGGRDVFDGGAGRDLLISDVTGIDPQGFTLLANLAAGVHGRVGAAAEQQDTLLAIEDFTTIGLWDALVTGNAAANLLTTDGGTDTVRGGAGDDTIVTGAGDDLLLGEAGSDRLEGGAGSDIYVVDASDTIVELAGDSGIDEMRIDQSATIAEGVERLVALGGGNHRLDGTAGAEALVGNGGNNILVGFGGEDTVTGGAGADTFALTAQRGTDPDVLVTDWGAGDRLAVDDQLVGLGGRGIDIRALTLDDFRTLRDSGSVGYNARSGELALDVDGDGTREVVATLEGGARIGLDDVLLF